MTSASLFDMTSRVGLVTGAAGGLGFAMAEAIAEQGARVVLTDIDREGLESAVSKLAARGLDCSAKYLDVSDIDSIEPAIAGIHAVAGRLDIVFANAGISAGPGPFTEAGAIDAVPKDRWTKVIDINLNSVFATMQNAARVMKAQRSGRIIVTASTAAFRADPMVGYAYSATKAAVANLVRQAATELAPHNVYVNAIAPGPFRTNIGNGRMRLTETERDFADSLPLGRIGEPREIKGAAILLASDAGSFMTGAVVPVDGGALAW